MDKRVIQKIIEHYGEPCPSFKYDNPLLDKNIANLLSKGFIKLLNKQDSGNTSQRLLILENIRKSCKVESPEHLFIDDNVTEILRNAYEKLPDDGNINRVLDSFLIRNLKELDISSIHPPYLKPDIVQALLNLNGDKKEIYNILMKDIIFWESNKQENIFKHILESMWNVECISGLAKGQSDDISIKIKPSIEKILLSTALEMLETEIIDEDDWFAENNELKSLDAICSVSSECFQICCSILNTIFIKTNFDIKMLRFITRFIDSIKLKVEYISHLYPSHLQHIVLLLDIELMNLEGEIKTAYTINTLKHLKSLHEECERDLIMLLSHFVQWFDIYHERLLEYKAQ